MNILSLLSIMIYASEVIVSPLASDFDKPHVSFGQIIYSTPAVLGQEQTPIVEVPIPSPAETYTLKKNPVTIALLGDSMTDTLGPEVHELKEELGKHYPNLHINILNYGVGATNIDYGIKRITNNYEYLGNPMPSLASQQPDIVVLESFGYNPYPFEEGAIDTHWLRLAAAVDTLKQSIPNVQIVIAATIAPNANVFGDGAPNIAFTHEEKWKRVRTIKNYLESTTRFATGQNLPLANAYHPSLQSDGNGNLTYINSGDHIHTSPEGKVFFAQILAKTLVEHRLLEL